MSKMTATTNLSLADSSSAPNMSRFVFMPPVTSEWALEAGQYLEDFRDYGMPSLFILGIILSIIVVCAFLRTDLKGLSLCLCYALICCIDAIYLFMGFIIWLSKHGLDIYNVEGVCQIVYYSNFLSIFLSEWILIICLAERSAAVYCPRISKKYFSAFRTKCLLISVSYLSSVAYLYQTWTSGVIQHGPEAVCSVIPENMENIQIMRKVDIFFSVLIPKSLGIILLLLISWRYFNSISCEEPVFSSYSSQEANSVTVALNDNNIQASPSISIRSVAERRELTFSALLLATFSLVLTFPESIMRTHVSFTPMHRLTGDELILLQIFEVIAKFYFVIKCFVFLVTMRSFRQALGLCMPGKLRRKHCCTQSNISEV